METVPTTSVTELNPLTNSVRLASHAENAWIEVLRDAVFERVLHRQIVEGIFAGKPVLALVGPSGAGKSTLAKVLAGRLWAVIVRLDDFCLPEPDRDSSVPHGKFDCVDADRVVRTLVAGHTAFFLRWDPAVGRRCIPTVLTPSTIIIFDGVLGLCVPAVLEYSQVRGFVDSPECVRKERVLHRAESGEEPSRYFGLDLGDRFDERVQNEDAAVLEQLADCTFYFTTTTLPSSVSIGS